VTDGKVQPPDLSGRPARRIAKPSLDHGTVTA
jgi:hypothetical protein